MPINGIQMTAISAWALMALRFPGFRGDVLLEFLEIADKRDRGLELMKQAVHRKYSYRRIIR